MRSRRVKVGSTYTFVPTLLDRSRPASTAVKGQRVTVVNMPGCPVANTMGHCHVRAFGGGEFLGLVCTNSLYRNHPLRVSVALPNGEWVRFTSEEWKTVNGAMRSLQRKYPDAREWEVTRV